MEIFLSCIFVIAIIILIFRIIDFSVKLIIHNKQMSTRNYDIESVLDRLQTAEKQFQKNKGEIKMDLFDGKKVVAVDFDGTIVEGNNYPDVGNPIPNAIDTIKLLMEDKDILLILWSCRDINSDPEAFHNMVKFCAKNGLNRFDAINDNVKPARDKNVKCRKVIADLYIDDNTCSWKGFNRLNAEEMGSLWFRLKENYRKILGLEE